MRRFISSLASALVLASFSFGCASTKQTNSIPNFHVVDATKGVYRGGEPKSDKGWAYLHSLGVTQVVKLNYFSEGSDAGALKYGIKIITNSIPPKDAEQFLEKPNADLVRFAVLYAADGHTFFHCENGWDRTGLVGGVYRVYIDHWTKDRAFKEMLKYGFHVECIGLLAYWIEDVTPPTAPPPSPAP